MDLLQEVRAARRLPSPEMARLIRRSAGVSQRRVAAELGVHRVTVARWEAGASVPQGTLRSRYAQLLADLQMVVAA